MSREIKSKKTLTVKQISNITGISRRSVQRNKAAQEFFTGFDRTSPGRPAKLYKKAVLGIWGIKHKESKKDKEKRLWKIVREAKKKNFLRRIKEGRKC